MQKTRKVPTRKCVGCQEMKEKRDLVRIVHTPENTVEIDSTGKRNGRGAYLCKNLECLVVARKRKALDRALKTSIPEEFYGDLTVALEGVVRG